MNGSFHVAQMPLTERDRRIRKPWTDIFGLFIRRSRHPDGRYRVRDTSSAGVVTGNSKARKCVRSFFIR